MNIHKSICDKCSIILKYHETQLLLSEVITGFPVYGLSDFFDSFYEVFLNITISNDCLLYIDCNLSIPILSFLSLSATGQGDPCFDYNILQDNEIHQRSAGIEAVDTSKCDSFLMEGWYRIQSEAGDDMPTSCPEDNRCGTTHPIWMDGNIAHRLFCPPKIFA